MAKPNNNEEVPPRDKDIANVTPMDAGAATNRILIDTLKEHISAVKLDVKDIRTELVSEVKSVRADVKEIRDYRYTDLLKYGAALLALIGGFITIYLKIEDKFVRLEDRLREISTTSTRIETKLDDLIQRLPPAPTPIPKK